MRDSNCNDEIEIRTLNEIIPQKMGDWELSFLLGVGHE